MKQIWDCYLMNDSSILRTFSVEAEHRKEALEFWIRDRGYDFEREDWNRLEVKPRK
jgi:hypothetical protein